MLASSAEKVLLKANPYYKPHNLKIPYKFTYHTKMTKSKNNIKMFVTYYLYLKNYSDF